MRFKRRFAHPDRAECAVRAQADKLIMPEVRDGVEGPRADGSASDLMFRFRSHVHPEIVPTASQSPHPPPGVCERRCSPNAPAIARPLQESGA